MRRSHRHAPFVGNTAAESDTAWKQQSARRLRRIVHQLPGETRDADALPLRRIVADGWGMKDGEQRVGRKPRPGGGGSDAIPGI